MSLPGFLNHQQYHSKPQGSGEWIWKIYDARTTTPATNSWASGAQHKWWASLRVVETSWRDHEVSGQIIVTSHEFSLQMVVFTPNGGLARLFQGNLGWWNIIPFGRMTKWRPFFGGSANAFHVRKSPTQNSLKEEVLLYLFLNWHCQGSFNYPFLGGIKQCQFIVFFEGISTLHSALFGLVKKLTPVFFWGERPTPDFFHLSVHPQKKHKKVQRIDYSITPVNG